MKKVTTLLRIMGLGVLILILTFPSTNNPITADYTTRSSIDIPSLNDPLALYVGRDGIYNFFVTTYPSTSAEQGVVNVYYVNGSTGEARIMLESVDLYQTTSTYFVNDNPVSILRKPHIFMVAPDQSYTDYQRLYLYRLDPNEAVGESISSNIVFNGANGSTIGISPDFVIYSPEIYAPTAMCLDQNVSLAWVRHVTAVNQTDTNQVEDYMLVESVIYDPVNLTFNLINGRPQELFKTNEIIYGAMQLGDTGSPSSVTLSATRFNIRNHPLMGRVLSDGTVRLIFFWYNSTSPMNKMTIWDLNQTSRLFEKVTDVDVPFTYTDAGWINVNGEDYFVFSKARYSAAQVDFFPEMSLYWLNYTSNSLVELSTFYKVLNSINDEVKDPWFELQNTHVYTDTHYVYAGIDLYSWSGNQKTFNETAGFLVGDLQRPGLPWHIMNDLEMKNYGVSEVPSVGETNDLIFYYTERAEYNDTSSTYGTGTLYWDSLIQSPWVTSPLTTITYVVSTETTTLETYTETINQTVTQNVTTTFTETYTVTQQATQSSSPVSIVPVLIALPLFAVFIKKIRK